MEAESYFDRENKEIQLVTQFVAHWEKCSYEGTI